MRISDWSSDVCSSDLECTSRGISLSESENQAVYSGCSYNWQSGAWSGWNSSCSASATRTRSVTCRRDPLGTTVADSFCASAKPATSEVSGQYGGCRSEEHTSELQSLLRISYAVFCLKKKKKNIAKQLCKMHTTIRSTQQTSKII